MIYFAFGAGNNPMVGMTVAVAVAVEEAMKAYTFSKGGICVFIKFYFGEMKKRYSYPKENTPAKIYSTSLAMLV